MAASLDQDDTDLQMDFEEDVVLQGGPLDQYLTEIADEQMYSYCVYHKVSDEEQADFERPDFKEGSQAQQSQILGKTKSLRSASFDSASPITNLGRIKSLTTNVAEFIAFNSLEKALALDTMEEIFQVLHSDSTDFSKLDLPNLSVAANHKLPVAKVFHALKSKSLLAFLRTIIYWTPPKYVFPISMLCISIISALEWRSIVSWLLNINYSNVQMSPLMAPLLCIALPCLCLGVHKIMKLKNFIVLTDCLIFQVNKFKKCFESFNHLIDRTLLLIREAEIISMGYTYYHASAPLNILKDKESQRGRCPVLRKMLLDILFESFKDFKISASEVVKYLPKEVQNKYEIDGVLTIPVDSIASFIKDRHEMLKENITVDLLKSFICLSRAQQAGFLEVMSASVQNWWQSLDETVKSYSEKLSNLEYTISNLCITIENFMKKLTIEYNFTKNNLFQEDNKVQNNIKPAATRPQPLFDNQVSSAILHLQSAMERVNSLHRIIANYQSLKDSDEVATKEFMKEFDLIISAFKTNADGAIACICNIEEDVNKSYLKTSSQNDPPNDSSGNYHHDSTRKLTQNQENVNTSKIDQETHGDVMIEGYSDAVEFDIAVKEDEYFLHEKERLQREQEGSKKLMRELKSIFSLKKDPAGLLTFDLVKRGATNVESIYDEDVSCSDKTTHLSSVISLKSTSSCLLQNNETYFEDNYQTADIPIALEELKSHPHHGNSQGTFPVTFGFKFDDTPQGNAMALVASAVANQCRLLGIAEQTIVADTSDIDSDAVNEDDLH